MFRRIADSPATTSTSAARSSATICGVGDTTDPRIVTPVHTEREATPERHREGAVGVGAVADHHHPFDRLRPEPLAHQGGHRRMRLAGNERDRTGGGGHRGQQRAAAGDRTLRRRIGRIVVGADQPRAGRARPSLPAAAARSRTHGRSRPGRRRRDRRRRPRRLGARAPRRCRALRTPAPARRAGAVARQPSTSSARRLPPARRCGRAHLPPRRSAGRSCWSRTAPGDRRAAAGRSPPASRRWRAATATPRRRGRTGSWRDGRSRRSRHRRW